MTDYKRIIYLEAVFDDSDIMTDYFNRDRPMFEWYICDLEGKRVTEGKLRRALKHLPEWLRAYEWKFRKGEVYSMSDHCYGQLRVDQGVGLTVRGEHTYGHTDSPLRFIITVTSVSCFEMNHSLEDQIPETKQVLSEMLEAKQEEWTLRRKEQKEAIKKAHIETIKTSHAVIDGKGFRVLTEEEKKKQIENYLKQARIKEEQKKERIRNKKPKNLLDFF